MKRSSFRFTICLALVFAVVMTASVSAHPVAIGDTSRVDWFGRGPSANNIGEIVRDTAGRGEFVWTDAKGDQRVASPIGSTGNITREADLAKFNITADATNLYFLAKMERISGLTNDPSPELMIAIDNDAGHTGGLTALPDGVATDVDGAAKWEYVVQTQFTKTDSAAKPIVYTTASSAACATCAAQLVNAAVRQGSFIEIAVPWNQIGGLPSAQNSIHFTVLTHYSDKRVPSDGIASKAIDVLSAQSTVAELSGDNAINAYIDLHFTATGEVFAPLLISEFLPDPPTSRDPEGEWIEIFNPTAFDVNLSGYKIGDQAYRGGAQGMVQLPNQLLPAGQAIVVANNKTVFQSRYPSVPAGKIIDLTTLAPYTSWATGNISLQNTNNGQPFKESLALLDARDTIVDLVQYTTPIVASGLDPDNKPIVLANTSVGPNASYDRCPASQDTNDSTFDFVTHTAVADQTPGTACLGVPGIDLRI
ncbi:MAG: lamin tail domain-containing protein, partial [Roseiflexaceae bacterium]